MTNRELDLLVAKEVMGKKYQSGYCDKKECEGKTMGGSQKGDIGIVYRCMICNIEDEMHCPLYSTSIVQAMEVFQKLRESGKWCCLNISSDYHYIYDVTLIAEDRHKNAKHEPTIRASSEELPRAICLAALRAVGVKDV